MTTKEVKCTWLLVKDHPPIIEIDILNEICTDKDDIEDYCDDYIAEEAIWSNIFLYSRVN